MVPSQKLHQHIEIFKKSISNDVKINLLWTWKKFILKITFCCEIKINYNLFAEINFERKKNQFVSLWISLQIERFKIRWIFSHIKMEKKNERKKKKREKEKKKKGK